MSISEQIETIVNSMTGNNNPPQVVKIRKGYDNNTADVITKNGILKNVKCSGEATAGDEALLIYDNGDMQTPFILLFNGNRGGGLTFDDVYPIGSIYMSVNSTSPAILFGGTWQQLTDTFLYATSTTADDNVTTAPSGQGSKDAVVVEHNHTQASHNHAPSTANYQFTITTGNISAGINARKLTDKDSNGYYYVVNDAGVTIGENGTTNSKQPTINNSGESGTNKNMPPYMKVYMWKRTA